MRPDRPDRLPVTIEHWQIFRAWLDDSVWHYALCHNGIPLAGLNYPTRDLARQVARNMDFEVIREDRCDEEIGPCAHQDQPGADAGQPEG
jgi:hypothetical protein